MNVIDLIVNDSIVEYVIFNQNKSKFGILVTYVELLQSVQ